LITHPESLCARLLKARYYPHGDLLDTVCSGNPSATWSSISYGLDLLKKGIIYRVGSGANIRAWQDNWIPRQSYMKVLTPRGNNCVRRVSELLDDQHNWKVDLIRQAFRPVDAELFWGIKVSNRITDDIIAWQPEKSDIFSVRSSYKLALNDLLEQCAFPASSLQPDCVVSCWSRIWKAEVPPKVKLYLLGRLQRMHWLLKAISVAEV
jgi:hypothetical protein